MVKKSIFGAKTSPERPGIEFEKIVARLQAKLDPNATITHDEILVDRLGQKRQFDIVFRGRFSGQAVLGVIECKDLSKKVGTPDVDAFQTKSSDVNANFKILISRRGFSSPALVKCKHYGISALSLISDDPSNQDFRLGTTWYAKLAKWSEISVALHVQPGEEVDSGFRPDEVKIDGKPVIAWFTNYLCSNPLVKAEFGTYFGVRVDFSEVQNIWVGVHTECRCTGLSFHAKRVLEEYEYFVRIGGEGFFDWQNAEIKLIPGGSFKMSEVPMDLRMWTPRRKVPEVVPNFLVMYLEIEDEIVFDETAVDLSIL